MKKTNRKLIPAVAMLLVSAIMLSTSSFAWFSMNKQADVNNMQVTATANSNLLISFSSTSGFTNSIASSKAYTLVPASTAKAASPSFFVVNKTGAIASDDAKYALDTTFKADSTGNSNGAGFLKETVYLKATGASAITGIKAKIEVAHTGTTASALESSLRIMLVVADTTPYLYAPVGTHGEDNYQPITGAGTAGSPALGEAITSATYTADESVVLRELGTTNPVKVDIYIWYEGQDANCMTDNAIDLKTTTFKVTFIDPSVAA